MAQLPTADNWHRGAEEDLTIIRDCYCPNCGGGNGVSTLLPTKIPSFQEIYVMHLRCDDCGFSNSEVNFGGALQAQGQRLTLKVTQESDLDRQIVKSDSASLLIPSLEFEIPPSTQRGTVSTIEGLLQTAADTLESLQPERLRLGDVENFHRCRHVIESLRRLIRREGNDDDDDESDDDDEEKPSLPFELILDDPAGNSYIENPHAPAKDLHLHAESYFRTPTQDLALGLQPSEQAVQDGTVDDANPQHKNPVNAQAGTHTVEVLKGKDDDADKPIGREEVMSFPSSCPHCHEPTETQMCVTDVPHFKEVIIMSLLCDHCGYKSNEIKGGGAIPEYGCEITVTCTTADDLAREVLKSDTAGVAIPEVELELNEGGLDGVYTTIEGLIGKMRERLILGNPFGSGDAAVKQHLDNDGGAFSALSPNHARYQAFLTQLQDLAAGKILPFTLVISDPLANSFVGPPAKDAVALSLQAEKEGNQACYDAYVDPGMVVKEYVRTHQQNEELGLNDMKTENYQSANSASDDVNDKPVNYGTDVLQELPDRIQRMDVRGPDHPLAVGKAPVEGDTTAMGATSLNFAVPAMGQRGTRKEDATTTTTTTDVAKLLHDCEYKDGDFMMDDDGYEGHKDGYVYKNGAQGLGYYKDVPLLQLWKEASPES